MLRFTTCQINIGNNEERKRIQTPRIKLTYGRLPFHPLPAGATLSRPFCTFRLDHRIGFSDRQKEFSSPYFANERQQCNYLEGELHYSF